MKLLKLTQKELRPGLVVYEVFENDRCIARQRKTNKAKYKACFVIQKGDGFTIPVMYTSHESVHTGSGPLVAKHAYALAILQTA